MGSKRIVISEEELSLENAVDKLSNYLRIKESRIPEDCDEEYKRMFGRLGHYDFVFPGAVATLIVEIRNKRAATASIGGRNGEDLHLSPLALDSGLSLCSTSKDEQERYGFIYYNPVSEIRVKITEEGVPFTVLKQPAISICSGHVDDPRIWITPGVSEDIGYNLKPLAVIYRGFKYVPDESRDGKD